MINLYTLEPLLSPILDLLAVKKHRQRIFGLVSPTYAWMDNGRDLVVSTVCLNALEHIEKPEIMQTWHSTDPLRASNFASKQARHCKHLGNWNPQNLVRTNIT